MEEKRSQGDGIQATPKKVLGATLRDPHRSLLREWLSRATNPDTDVDRTKKWNEIGWEVFERKALLMAAARDLEENGVSDPTRLAAADIFVEKAQRILTARGLILYRLALVTSLLAVTVLGLGAWYVYHLDVLRDLLHTEKSSESVSSAYLWVLLVKSTTAGAFVLAVAHFLISLTRAFLHEGTVLYSRRHSLRFGRLFVYLMSGKMTREDLEAVFNWNADVATAFRDIRADLIAKAPVAKVLEAPVETLKATTELLKLAMERREKTDEKASPPGGSGKPSAA